MNGNKRATPIAGLDVGEDAPELTDAFFERADELVGRKVVRRGRPPKAGPLKQATTIRFDADVLAALKASGAGWQTRVNDAMRRLVKAGKL